MHSKRSLLALSLSLAATLVLIGPAPPALADTRPPQTPAARETEPDAGETATPAAETAPTRPATGPAPAAPPAATDAQRVVVDPETGRVVAEPPASRDLRHVSAAMRLRTSTSHHGLVEEPAPLGSIKVDLRGRFMSLLEARVRDDDGVSVGHGLPGTDGDRPDGGEEGGDDPR